MRRRGRAAGGVGTRWLRPRRPSTPPAAGLAFLFNGIGIPVAATGLVYPVWAMVAMALSVTTIFLNSLWGRPWLFFDALASVGRPAPAADAEARAA